VCLANDVRSGWSRRKTVLVIKTPERDSWCDHEMDDQLVGYVELLRGMLGPDSVQTSASPTAAQLEAVELELGVTLPDDYKAVVRTFGSLTAGALLVVHGVGDLTGAPITLARVALPDETKVYTLGDPAPFGTWLAEALQRLIEVRGDAIVDAAGDFIDDTPGVGQATLQMHAVPSAVVAVLKKEPAVADEITLYTSVAEFREQTVHWEKYARDTDPPAAKEMVRRMRSLLKQPGIAKLTELVGDSVDLPKWPDAIVLCLGENATESLALRGTTTLPSDGTDTLHMLWISEVKQVATVIGDSEQRLRAGYRPDMLRARGLFSAEAPNDAAFLEELCALWSNVVDAIREAAANGSGWLIRRTNG